MPIETTCGGCGKLLAVGDEYAGRRARCPNAVRSTPFRLQQVPAQLGSTPNLPAQPAPTPSAPAQSGFQAVLRAGVLQAGFCGELTRTTTHCWARQAQVYRHRRPNPLHRWIRISSGCGTQMVQSMAPPTDRRLIVGFAKAAWVRVS